jgi:H+-transporting ATPase
VSAHDVFEILNVLITPSRITLVIIILETNLFENRFGVHLSNAAGTPKNANDYQLHMIVYLQVTTISQALIFVTRSHGFFFMEMPSYVLLGAFCISQLISSIIAAYADWGFTQIHGISGGWIGIIWVWNLIWFLPLDGIKFAMKATIIKYLRQRHKLKLAAEVKRKSEGVLPSVVERFASLYSSRVGFIRHTTHNISIGFKGGKKVQMTRTFSISFYHGECIH